MKKTYIMKTVCAVGLTAACAWGLAGCSSEGNVSSGTGGVAVSALEMSQNSMRLYWSFEEVDNHLKKIMGDLYNNVISAAQEYGMPQDLVAGANIAGFLKVANSMLAYGLV